MCTKIVKSILCKTIAKYGKYWHGKLSYALWAYRTSIKTIVGKTYFSLMYGDETMVPLKLEIPSLHVSLNGFIHDEDKRKMRLAQLEDLD